MGVVDARAAADLPRRLPATRSWRACARPPGCAFCGNRPADGMAVIEELGAHHLRTGEVILYTSADSVLQLAAHDDVLPEPDLLAACAAARAVMTGEHAVGRVIARPFTGAPGAFTRTTGRKDFSVRPAGPSYLDELQEAGVAGPRGGEGARPVRRRRHRRRPRRRHERAGARGDRRAWSTSSTPAWCSRTSSRPTSSTATATTPRASRGALTEIDAAVGGWLERLRARRPPGPDRRPRRRPDDAPHATTRASTRRCWPASRATAAAATTARWPTSAPAPWTGWPAATTPACRARASSDDRGRRPPRDGGRGPRPPRGARARGRRRRLVRLRRRAAEEAAAEAEAGSAAAAAAPTAAAVAAGGSSCCSWSAPSRSSSSSRSCAPPRSAAGARSASPRSASPRPRRPRTTRPSPRSGSRPTRPRSSGPSRSPGTPATAGRSPDLLGPDLLAEWTRRLDDFDAKGWHNRVRVLGTPSVRVRRHDEPRRGRGRPRRGPDRGAPGRPRRDARRAADLPHGPEPAPRRRCASGGRWPSATGAGACSRSSRTPRASHHLDAPIVATPWGDDARLRDEASTELAVAERPPRRVAPGELADLRVRGHGARRPRWTWRWPTRASTRRSSRRPCGGSSTAWTEAVDGPDAPLEALASRAAVRRAALRRGRLARDPPRRPRRARGRRDASSAWRRTPTRRRWPSRRP